MFFLSHKRQSFYIWRNLNTVKFTFWLKILALLFLFLMRRKFSLVARYSLEFTRCLLLVVKPVVICFKILLLLFSRVARCKSHSVLVAKVARWKKLLVSRWKICLLLVVEVDFCKNYWSVVIKKTWQLIFIKANKDRWILFIYFLFFRCQETDKIFVYNKISITIYNDSSSQLPIRRPFNEKIYFFIL